MFDKSELSRFDAQIRIGEESSLRKAKPILDLMSKNISDDLSVGYRLKTYFNYYIKNSNSGMEKVATMQKQFRDYYENFINMQRLIVEKLLEVKKNLLKQKKIIYNL